MKTFKTGELMIKRFLNIFFTTPSKAAVTALLIICSWLMNSEVVDILQLYRQDSTAVTNVLLQREDYDYKTSYFLTNEIETAIENVLEYSLNYHRNDISKVDSSNEKSAAEAITYLAESFVKNQYYSTAFINAGFIELIPCEESQSHIELAGEFFTQSVCYEEIRLKADNLDLNDFYKRATDEDYAAITGKLESYINFNFAVVNHNTNLIVSNIPSLNAKNSDVTVRRYFGEDKNLLIVRDAKTPFFESGTMSEYVEFVSEQAKKYGDNFDVYISFGNNLEFAGDGENYSLRHTEALGKIGSDLKNTVVFLSIMLVLFIIILRVAGRREVAGKCYMSLSDRLPNDLKFLLYLIIYISMSALYENSLYMALRTSFTEDYWLNFSPEYYMLRSDISMVIMICIITSFACTIKRQLRCGTVISNSYIYKIIKNFKSAEPDR